MHYVERLFVLHLSCLDQFEMSTICEMRVFQENFEFMLKIGIGYRTRICTLDRSQNLCSYFYGKCINFFQN